VFGEPANHSPSPLTSMMTAVDSTNRRTPAASTNVPSRISGTLLL
jgi:hypothetical protein